MARASCYFSIFVLLHAAPSIVRAEYLIWHGPWKHLRALGMAPNGEIIPSENPEYTDQLKIVNLNSKLLTPTFFTTDDQNLLKDVLVLRTQIKCQDVVRTANIEIVTHYSNGLPHVSIHNPSLKSFRPPQLSGTTDWLPLHCILGQPRKGATITRIECNLKLPDKAMVFIRPLSLYRYVSDEDPWADPGQWWGRNDRHGMGYFFAGVFLMILHSLTVFVNAYKGIVARSATRIRFLLIPLTAISVYTLVYALCECQPYVVWFPLAVIAFVTTFWTLAGYIPHFSGGIGMPG